MWAENNALSGPLPLELGQLTQLESLDLDNNQFSGTIPLSFGGLTNLTYLSLAENDLSGSVPAGVGDFTSNIAYIDLHNNHFSGELPPQIGQLTQLTNLLINGNRFSGPLPPEIGNLTNLVRLRLENNAFSGEVPLQMTNLTQLRSGSYNTDLGYNALKASDPDVYNFLTARDSDWSTSQTVAPQGLTATFDGQTVTLNWQPISYTWDPGDYEIRITRIDPDPYSVIYYTADKATTQLQLVGLEPGTYTFAVRTFTASHGEQQNDLTSPFSPEVTVTVGEQPPLAIAGLSTTSPAGQPQQEFQPGEAVVFTLALNNAGAQALDVPYTWTITGPCGNLLEAAGQLAVTPGAGAYTFSHTLPADACAGPYRGRFEFNADPQLAQTVAFQAGAAFNLFLTFIER